MKTYVIKFTIQDKIESYYIVEANNIMSAKNKAKNQFLKQYPGADFSCIKMSLDNPTSDKIREILEIIKEN